jgi:hypothetical protein
MHDDVTDHDGTMLLRSVYRLDSLVQGLNAAFEECGIPRKLGENDVVINKNDGRMKYIPSLAQKAKINRIYGSDFELYETARH